MQGPFSTARPPYITSTSSATSAITPRSWVIITMAESNSRWRSCSRSRICACTVTSSAVVGSSAISSVGSLTSAIAIIARWRMPPENWCGKSSTRDCGCGIPTRSSISTARLRATCFETLWWIRYGLGDLAPDRVERVQRGQRVLEDHRDLLAAQLAQRGLGGADDLAAVDPDRAFQPGLLRVVQPEHRHRGDALAGAGLPHDAEGLAAAHGVAEVADGLDQAVVGREAHRQVAHLEQGRRRPGRRTSGRGVCCVTRSSLGGRGSRRRCRRPGWPG